MRLALDKSFFFGSAASVACGLALGLTLHGPWETSVNPGLSGILFSPAQAAEAHPAPDDLQAINAVYAPPDDIYSDATPLAEEYVPATPQPLTRLNAAKYDAQVAAAETTQRVDVGQAEADDNAPSRTWPVASLDYAGRPEAGGAADAARPLRLSAVDGN